jgi:predicted nuclease of restriction endonuclease-like RecB superfamily
VPKYFTIIYDDKRGRNLVRVKMDKNGYDAVLSSMGFYSVSIDKYIYKDDEDIEEKEYMAFLFAEDLKKEIKEFNDDEDALLWFKLNYGG